MKESYRCSRCRALLFKADQDAIAAELEIKCRRCRSINILRPMRPAPIAR
ncbi:MAG: Com family DNA-binding transcriptional regulator [Sphingorhabdus sp.]